MAPSPPPPKYSSPLPQPTPPLTPFLRDRIVILGRSQAGKTVYITRLYYELYYNSRKWGISLRSRSGPRHAELANFFAELTSGRWPKPTNSQAHIDCRLVCDGTERNLTMLDYSGEDFSNAFVRGVIEGENVTELIEHIDHASGVILLIDPKNAVDNRNPGKLIDDDFGMPAVVARIRGFPGGSDIPIAIVLTKFDLNQELIRDSGGFEVFVDKYLHQVWSAADGCRAAFTCAAVAVRQASRTGLAVPDVRKCPVNVVEPLKWILERLSKHESRIQRRAVRAQSDSAVDRAVAHAREILASGATESNSAGAVAALRALPEELQRDRRVCQVLSEASGIVEEAEQRRVKRNNWLWALLILIGLVAGVCLVAVVVSGG